MKPRIGVLTSGGDCPGLNAVLRGVVLAAEKLGWEVVGFRDGFEGLLPPGNQAILDRQSINGIMALGGTIIGTTNRGHFIAKVGAGNRTIVPADIIAGAKKILDELHVKALIIIGGDGSMVTAQQLQEAGINCIGVPKTIDNDLEATATTFGFDSAVAVVMDALDRVHTTATSHRRVMVVEVMGRHAGWIALHGGIAGGADIILIPEIPFDFDKIASVVKAREAAGYLGSVVVVAEGARPKHGEQVKRDVESGEFRLGGIGEIVAREIAKRTGKETRCLRSRPSAAWGRTDDVRSNSGNAFRRESRSTGQRRTFWVDGQLPKLSGAPGAHRGSRQSAQTGSAERRNGTDRA